MALYQLLAEEVSAQIQSGVLRPGDQLPSVRRMSSSRRISAATVQKAYQYLEDRGLVSTRPRSGYYVKARLGVPLAEPATPDYSGRVTTVDIADLLFEVLDSIKDRTLVPLGSAFASPMLFPLSKLAQELGKSARRMDPWRTVEDLPPGNAELRRHIAMRYLQSGIKMAPDEIIITSGATEALLLSLQAVTSPGDLVAVESPSFYGALHAVELLGLRAVEIPVSSRDGMDISLLAKAVETGNVKACWLMANFENPVGCLMPVEHKREVVALLARHEIPLIEDDTYAELFFDVERPPPAKAFDLNGGVLHCGSFSKCLAPGYRVGWASAGRFTEQVRRSKLLYSIGTNIYAQEALAQFVKHGGYEYHLRQLRTALQNQQASMLDAIARYFPSGTCVSRPRGGYFVWVELPQQVDSVKLYRRCLEAGVSIAPGPLFSAKQAFRSHIRINCGHPWSADIDRGVATVGRLATAEEIIPAV
jgi:DNA-binding transcriptional MocR family regulator